MEALEIFIGILHHLPLSVHEFKSDTVKLHRCFYELKRIYPNNLKEFKFDVREYWPYSERLECIIDDFMFAGKLWYNGIRGDRYEFCRESVDAAYRVMEPSLSRGQKSELLTMSQIFQQATIINVQQ